MRWTMMTAAAAILWAQGAWAGTFQESLAVGGDLTKVADVTAHDYQVDGAVLYAFDYPGFAVQLGGTATLSRLADNSVAGWQLNADAFWRDAKGTVGLTVGGGSMAFFSDAMAARSYGAFGEWYALDALTVRIKGGAASTGDLGGGAYAGAGVEYYLLPDLGLTVEGNYANLRDIRIKSGDIWAEYLLSQRIPVSIRLGYRYSEIASDHAKTYMVRLAYRFGEGSLSTLDRTGALVWSGLLPLM